MPPGDSVFFELGERPSVTRNTLTDVRSRSFFHLSSYMLMMETQRYATTFIECRFLTQRNGRLAFQS
jgi:hypothetical protein